MKPLIVTALLVFPWLHAPAKDVRDVPRSLVAKIADPELRKMTLKVLRDNPVDFSEQARRNLVAKGERFDRARLEITGVWASDDSNRFDAKLFDAQIRPSYTAIVPEPGALNPAAGVPQMPVNVMNDLADFVRSAKGEMTDRTKSVLADYRDLEVNELVAHSWGCEVVYAAILNGYLRPPKKLIVVGVPDDDFAKWEMLAARTGTEVHWARATNDRVASNAGSKLAHKSTPEELAAQWDKLCSGPNRAAICGAHGRAQGKATREDVGRIPEVAGHDRTEYYAILKKKGVLKGSPLDLRRSETAVRNAEITRLQKAALEDATQKARLLLDHAREEKLQATRRAYDNRVKAIMAEMARRSCANPGSVSQEELDLLPELHVPAQESSIPAGLDGRSVMVYLSLGPGVNATSIRDLSIPIEPIKVQAQRPGPKAVQPVPPSPFALALPRLQAFAIQSCRAPGSVEPVVLDINDSFFKANGGFDWIINSSIEYYRVGLSGCSLQLYDKLIEQIKNRTYGAVVTSDWVRRMVAPYSPPPPMNAGSPPGEGRRTTGGGETTPAPPPPKAHNSEGTALQQLREIERRKRWHLPPRP